MIQRLNHSDAGRARVNRGLSFGIGARVEQDGLNGASGQHFEIEISRERAAAPALTSGQPVRLEPSTLRLFPRDESRASSGQKG